MEKIFLTSMKDLKLLNRFNNKIKRVLIGQSLDFVHSKVKFHIHGYLTILALILISYSGIAHDFWHRFLLNLLTL